MLKKRNSFGFMVSLHRLFVAIAPRPYRERITANKREIKNFPKLPLATSFIRQPLYEIPNPRF